MKGREILFVEGMLVQNNFLFDEQHEQLDVDQAMVCVKLLVSFYITTIFPEMNMLLNSTVLRSSKISKILINNSSVSSFRSIFKKS